MKVSFITIQVGANFGSVLQCYALYKKLNELSCKAEVINYIPSRVTYKRLFFRRSIIRLCKSFFWFPKVFINNKIYTGFLKRHTKVTTKYYSLEELSINPPKADVYLTGSDQVWNSKHNEYFNPIYYFSFIPSNKKKVAFSSSIGREDISEDEKLMVKRYLDEYKYISVREQSAVELLESIGLKNIEHTLDPTFLLDRFDWEKIMSKRLLSSKYLLMYVPYNIVDKEKVYKTARIIAQKKNLKVVAFSWDYFKESLADKTIRYASPNDFLSLMHHAEYIITNSFHGAAFSINLNKLFWVYMPSGYGTRIKSILDLCQLGDR